MKKYYCKKKTPIFCLKYSIFVFYTTDKMKSVYFSKNIQSLMLSIKQKKNMKKREKKRCFKSMKIKVFFLLSIEIFFKKKVPKRYFFFFCSKNAHQLCKEMKKVIFRDNAVAPPGIPTFLIWFICKLQSDVKIKF